MIVTREFTRPSTGETIRVALDVDWDKLAKGMLNQAHKGRPSPRAKATLCAGAITATITTEPRK